MLAVNGGRLQVLACLPHLLHGCISLQPGYIRLQVLAGRTNCMERLLMLEGEP